MQLKTYYKMCKHHGNDEGCDAAMDAMCDLLNQSVSFLLPWYKLQRMTMVNKKNSKYFLISFKLRWCYSFCSICVLLGHILVRDVPIRCGEPHGSDIVLNQLLLGRQIHLGLPQGFQKETAAPHQLYQWMHHGNTLIH